MCSLRIFGFTASDETDQNIYLTKTPGHNDVLLTHRIEKSAPPPTALSLEAAARLPIKINQCDCATKEARNPAFEHNLQHPADDLIFATSIRDSPNEFEWWQIQPMQAKRRTPY